MASSCPQVWSTAHMLASGSGLPLAVFAQEATAQLLQVAALASTVSAANERQVAGDLSSTLSTTTAQKRALFMKQGHESSDESSLEQVNEYTVEEPLSSDSSAPAAQAPLNDAGLGLLVELIPDADAYESPRSASPCAWPAGSATAATAEGLPSANVWSRSLSPATLRSPGSETLNLTLDNLPSPSSSIGSLSPADLEFERFLSAYDGLVKDDADKSQLAVADRRSQLSKMSLGSSGSLEDLLAQPSVVSPPTAGTRSTSVENLASVSITKQNSCASAVLDSPALLAKSKSVGAHASPRLTPANRSLSTPSYKVTLPDSSDSVDQSNSGAGSGSDGSDGPKRLRGPRGKKRRSSVAASSASGKQQSTGADKDSFRYRRRRTQNNEAVRRCRQRNKEKYEDSVRQTASLQAENTALKERLASMEQNMATLRHQLATVQLSPPLPHQGFNPLVAAAAAAAASSSSSSSDEEYMAQGSRVGTVDTTALWDMFYQL